MFTEIELNKSKNTLIVGENGSGKTTLLDALCFVCFGKPFRDINKPKLINSQNQKEMVVEIEFQTNGSEYKIVRGMKPNIFEIFKDGKLLDQGTKTSDYQDDLENYILRLNYKTFTQVVILGSASFKPFMQLQSSVRRSIIEDLLDIQIFSTMNQVARQKLQLNKEEFEKNRTISIVTEQKRKILETTLAGLEQADAKKHTNITDKIEEIEELLAEKTMEYVSIPDYDSLLQSILIDIKSQTQKIKTYNELHSKIKFNIDKLNQDNIFYHDNNNCPTCRQGIEHHFKEKITEDNNIKLMEYNSGLEKLVDKISDINSALAELEKQKTQTQNDIWKKETKRKEIESLQKSKNELQKDLEGHMIDNGLLLNTKKELNTAANELSKLASEKENLLIDRKYYELIISMLKDGGIKTKIIKQYLPIINKYINHYLNAMSFSINFNINEEFEETILSRFRDEFTYHSFSEGEKKRIDLAILFAWRAVARMKNSINTNLLIFDETFDSSLDGKGTDEFMKIINALTKDSNCIIISHKVDQLVEKFDNIIRFEKIKDFSRII
jgi:DNA repair exonuclease SbcCD ATPase subunit